MRVYEVCKESRTMCISNEPLGTSISIGIFNLWLPVRQVLTIVDWQPFLSFYQLWCVWMCKSELVAILLKGNFGVPNGLGNTDWPLKVKKILSYVISWNCLLKHSYYIIVYLWYVFFLIVSCLICRNWHLLNFRKVSLLFIFIF